MNQKMLELLGEHADKYPKYLEQHFPHVFEKLLEIWGTAEMRGYFDELVMSKRANRMGFPFEAVAEIWDLNKVYTILHPEDAPVEGGSMFGDIWNLDSDTARHSWGQGKPGEEEKKA